MTDDPLDLGDGLAISPEDARTFLLSHVQELADIAMGADRAETAALLSLAALSLSSG